MGRVFNPNASGIQIPLLTAPKIRRPMYRVDPSACVLVLGDPRQPISGVDTAIALIPVVDAHIRSLTPCRTDACEYFPPNPVQVVASSGRLRFVCYVFIAIERWFPSRSRFCVPVQAAQAGIFMVRVSLITPTRPAAACRRMFALSSAVTES